MTKPTGRPKGRPPKQQRHTSASIRPPLSDPDARAERDRLIHLLQRDLHDRNALERDLAELDQTSMPTVAERYQRHIDRLTAHIKRLDDSIAAIERGEQSQQPRRSN